MDETDTDAQMQLEKSSQTGSVDRMELEPPHLDAMPAADASLHTDMIDEDEALPAAVDDQDMQDEPLDDMNGDDALDLPAQTIQGSLKQDDEMNAEIQEQQHMAEERDWKDTDGSVAAVALPDVPVQTSKDALTSESSLQIVDRAIRSSRSPEVLMNAVNQSGPEDLSTSEDSSKQGQQEDTAKPSEPGQLTLEQVLSPNSADQFSSAIDDQVPDIPSATDSTILNTDAIAQETEEDVYADAPPEREPIASTSAQPYSEAIADSSSTLLTRPSLQKDYLAHIDVFNGQDFVSSDSTAQRTAPHVSLIYDNLEYSLFRPSSSPSGDHEQVLFDDVSASEDHLKASAHSTLRMDHELYYTSLENFIEALHRTFPALKGDGENELILDFGILDMQVSEDNAYCQQLSLHDFDRIRTGMCQPEFDRLQITLKTAKRFVYRFNELAEHCYRMFAGSEDDSGTIHDEEDFDSMADETYENYDEADQADKGEDLEEVYDDTGDAAVDYIDGRNIEDLADPTTALNEYEAAEAEAELEQPELDPSSTSTLHSPQNEHEVKAVSASGASDAVLQMYGDERSDDAVDGGDGDDDDVHPPSDEHYVDPEFVQDELVESYDEAEEDASTVQGDSLPVETEDEDVHIVDPEATVEEAAQQVEEYEEAVLDGEEGLQHESEAATKQSPLPTGSDRKVDVNGNEDAQAYYHELASPTNEEVILLEHPRPSKDNLDGPENYEDYETEIVKGTTIEDGHVEAATEPDTRVLSSKRSRDELEDSGQILEESGYHEAVNENTIEPKRPKIAA